jgi:MoaA/NifB/PqqE/SkfB family radical SAM enzyme
VIGEVGAADAPVFLICARRDALPAYPGAHDKASGIGIVLKTAELFAREVHVISPAETWAEIPGAANRLHRVLRLYGSNGSPRAWRQLFTYLCRRAVRRPVPEYIWLAPTYRCQCRCPHCYSNAPDRREHIELETGAWKSVLDQAKELGVLEATFSAGEPLLRDDIADLVRHAHDIGLLTRISTNGLLLTRERVAELKEAGLTQCGVSIDDADPEVHDRLRGVPGSHRRALEAIRRLQDAGIQCQILGYAARRLIPEGLERIVALGRDLGVMSVFFSFPIAAGRWEDAADELLTEEEKAQVRALRDMKLVHLEIPTPRYQCCVVTKSMLFVSPAGDVAPCPFTPYVMGNIQDYPLAEFYRRYYEQMTLTCAGHCPLNRPECRETLKSRVEAVAASLT